MARGRGNDIQRKVRREEIGKIKLRGDGIGSTWGAANRLYRAAIHGKGPKQAGAQNQITCALAAHLLRQSG